MTDGPYFSINGKRAVSGLITKGMYGPWAADIVLAEPDLADTNINLRLNNMSMKGTVIRAASFAGSRSARIVAGAGGWRDVIEPKGYFHDVGVKLSSVLQDAARTAKEKINVSADRVIGTHYSRKRGPAERVLKYFLDGKWWIDDEGVTQTGDRSNKAIVTPFTVVKWSGAKGRFEIATENYEDWQPGRTFTAPTVSGVRTISSVSYAIENDGKLRLDILTGKPKEDRLSQDIRAIIRDEIDKNSHDFVEYEITGAREMEIDCKPLDGKDSDWPPLSGVKIKPSILGETVTPTVGKKALLFFMSSDPTKVRVISVEGITQQTALDSSGSVHITVGGLLNVNGAAAFIARADKVDARLATIQSNFDDHAHPTPWGPTLQPLVPIGTLTTTACTKMKTD